jgi:hypothetical protein
MENRDADPHGDGARVSVMAEADFAAGSFA